MRPLSRSERRTVAAGAAVSALALAVTLVALPLADRWLQREETIAAEAGRLARLQGLLADEPRLRAAVERAERSAGPADRRVLTARTAGLAASTLQGRLQDFADASQLTVSGLDVTGAPIADQGDLPAIPATLSAVGDIHGIAAMLQRIEQGPLLLEVVEVTIARNTALRGNLLQMTVSLRAPFAEG